VWGQPRSWGLCQGLRAVGASVSSLQADPASPAYLDGVRPGVARDWSANCGSQSVSSCCLSLFLQKAQQMPSHHLLASGFSGTSPDSAVRAPEVYTVLTPGRNVKQAAWCEPRCLLRGGVSDKKKRVTET
jgi:hypothetical protein